jgi:hypothetical protein
MKRISCLLLLTACDWNGSASYYYSNSWEENACDKAKISELRKEYEAKVADYKKKYADSPGQLKYGTSDLNGCEKFFVGYSNKRRFEHESE